MARGSSYVAVDVRFELGEGPLWDGRGACLYGVDIAGRQIWRGDEHGVLSRWPVDSQPGCLGLREGGGLIVGLTDGFAIFDPDSGAMETLVDPDMDKPGNRLNDGAVDPRGRFWAGTMDAAEEVVAGSLYRLDPDGTISCHATDIGISNGIGWSPDHTVMYHADTMAGIIYAYDFDPAAGRLSSRRVFVSSEDAPGRPDGLTVDADGGVWNARWDGSCLVRFTDRGAPDRVVQLETPRPTSVMFGGPGLETLFVTTACYGLSDESRDRAPLSGAVLAIDGMGKGLSEHRFQA